jgi:membrane-associated phospholipid phosphatase
VSIIAEPATVPVEVRADPRLARRFLLAAVVSAVVCVAIYVVLVRTSLGQRFDNAVLMGSHEQQSATRISDTTELQRITADSFALVLAGIVVFGLLRRRLRLGLGVAAAAALSVIGTDVLRKWVLTRPDLVDSNIIYPVNTFPSGHTATAISCALALVVVSPPAWRGISAVVAGSYAWFTAGAVQTAGWHRPSDAIGAAFLSFAAVAIIAAVVAAKRPVGSGTRFGHVPAFAVLGAVWLGAGAISALNAARVLRFLANNDATTLNPTPAILNNAYQFSVNFTIVVVVSLLAAMLLLLGRSDLDQPGTT